MSCIVMSCCHTIVSLAAFQHGNIQWQHSWSPPLCVLLFRAVHKLHILTGAVRPQNMKKAQGPAEQPLVPAGTVAQAESNTRLLMTPARAGRKPATAAESASHRPSGGPFSTDNGAEFPGKLSTELDSRRSSGQEVQRDRAGGVAEDTHLGMLLSALSK